MSDLIFFVYRATGLADSLSILLLFLAATVLSVVEWRSLRGSYGIPALLLAFGPLILGLGSSLRTWRYIQGWTAAGAMSPEDLAEAWRLAPVPALYGAALTAAVCLLRLVLGRVRRNGVPTPD